MKISVTLSIDLDAKQWAEYQGLVKGDDVRADVRNHVLNLIQGSQFLEEADAEITLKS